MNSFTINRRVSDSLSFVYSRGIENFARSTIHPWHELLYYIDGDVTFLSEHFQDELQPGSFVLIPRGSFHHFFLRDPARFTRLAIYLSDDDILPVIAHSGVLSSLRILPSPSPALRYPLERICRALEADTDDERCTALLTGAVSLLLAELALTDAAPESPPRRTTDPLIADCIRHIDTHPGDDLRTETLAQRLAVSASTLQHRFKCELGVPLYRYITERRLTYARRLIAQGENPTGVYAASGYNDYSAFYRAYCKYFGHAPSDDKGKV